LLSHGFAGTNDFELTLAFHRPLMEALDIRARFCEPWRPNDGFRAINLRFRPAAAGRHRVLADRMSPFSTRRCGGPPQRRRPPTPGAGRGTLTVIVPWLAV
jgi:hypothetical protein